MSSFPVSQCMSLVTAIGLFSPQPCLQYWPEPGLQQYGPMEVEYVSGAADEDIVSRLFRVQNITRVRVSPLAPCQRRVAGGGGLACVCVCAQVSPRHLPVQRSSLGELVCRGWIAFVSCCFGEGLGHP